jgi:hypothetical protein
VDCWNTLGFHLEVQNLSVAFNVPWFPKNLIIHPLAIYCVEIEDLCVVAIEEEMKKFSNLVVTR